MEGLVVNLVNIYAPQLSSRRPQFYQQVSDFLGTLDSHECLVLGGDFNTTLEERDRSGAKLSPAAANILQGIVEHHSLVDVWRDHQPDDTSTFTFVRVEAHRSHHSRLGRIYLSRFHLSQAHSSAIRPAPFSNHHLVTVTVSLRAERPGPAYWHFNNSLLEDEGFVTSFREFWLAWREQWRAFPSVRRWWDLGKVRAKLFCRDYTRGTNRQRNAAIEQLEREVLEMERHLAANPEDPSLCGACREKREELRALEDQPPAPCTGYSMIFLQETHTDLTAEDSWRLEWGDTVYFSHSTIRQAGVMTLFAPDLWPKVLGVTEAVQGCLLHLRVHIEGLMVNLVNVYAPTSGPEQLQFYQQASAFLGTLDSHECLVLGGDFNTTLEERDCSGTKQSPAAADTLREIVKHHSLVDIWCDHHPDDTSTFTFVRVEAHRSSHSRLDRIYLSCFHLSRAYSSSIRLAPFSDHQLATVTASLCAERPGLAYWHFNNSLLEDEGFVTSFWEFWLAWRDQWRAFPSMR
ncbi:unnamed protein product [Caretta caretta]